MKLALRLTNDLGLHVPLRVIIDCPTPRSLAGAIAACAHEGDAYHPVVRLCGGGGAPPLFCIHAASGLSSIYHPLADRLAPGIPAFGFEARGVDEGLRSHESIAEMAAAYIEALREIQPHGPYQLLGWSFGGGVAHEMTRLLELGGEHVAVLLPLDTYFSDFGTMSDGRSEGSTLDKLGPHTPAMPQRRYPRGSTPTGANGSAVPPTVLEVWSPATRPAASLPRSSLCKRATTGTRTSRPRFGAWPRDPSTSSRWRPAMTRSCRPRQWPRLRTRSIAT
ncbi:alpha/beta fold hydrolase [Acuticoccus sp.]|uniref:thioesterase domain-containing protein n=1 Tax=Acuticoccus sp. TaxID=1904378 RepID=UPI003B515B10